MKIRELSAYIDGTIVCNESKADKEVYSAFSSDMMSDVLAFVMDQGVLITGLINPQIVRTALMMDIECIVVVRGKTPDESIISLAEANGIVLITTKKNMFETSGRLYSAGLKA